MLSLSSFTTFANSLFLSFVVGIPLYAAIRKVKVFDSFIAGAQEGFSLVIKLMPYLVGMLVAIGMLRASGALDNLANATSPWLAKIGMPPEVLPLALIRPFSGTAANGMLAELIHHHGGDSFISQLAATIMGSTETTFYVIAVYFGAINVARTRYAIPAGLIADLAGVFASLAICHWLL